MEDPETFDPKIPCKVSLPGEANYGDVAGGAGGNPSTDSGKNGLRMRRRD